MLRARTVEGVFRAFREIGEEKGVILCAVKLRRGERKQEFKFAEAGTEPVYEYSVGIEGMQTTFQARHSSPSVTSVWDEIEDAAAIAACLIDRLELKTMLGVLPESDRQDNPVEPLIKELVGKYEGLEEIQHIARKIAEHYSLILLLQGESGTGKEVIAKGIHYNSSTANLPFVPINCGAIPAALIESELFGHEQGAFTDAKKLKIGLFESAKGGTIFLDEIGELPLELQSKLLRVLEERKFRRVGGLHEIQLHARIIAATNRDLKKESDAGRFRNDLYHRLAVFQINLPALRERGEDILILARHFIEKFNREYGKNVRGLSPEVIDIFRVYPWSGNVRELHNTIERAIVLQDGQLLTTAYLPPHMVDGGLKIGGIRHSAVMEEGETFHEHLDRIGLEILQAASTDSNGNMTKAARRLGVERSSLIHWEKRARTRLKRRCG
jgi:transcriptional regulator with PAS, ATPase and Fis domain